MTTAGIAAENGRCRKKLRLSIGWSVILSQTANRARTARPPAPAPITRGDDQPRAGASMIDHRIPPIPAIDRPAPARSGALAAGFLESGTSQQAASRPAMAMGTLIRKTEPHQKRASRKPPMIGPRATPMPLVAPQRPIARWRSAGSRNMLLMIDSVDGIISAPPMPMLARAAIRVPTSPEKAAQAEPPAKTARPASSVFLRPIRSARLPAASSEPANTTM